MPVYAAITPNFSNTEGSLDALNASAFYTDSITLRGGSKSKHHHTTTLAHFEKIFVFMVDPKSSRGAAIYSFFIGLAAFASCFMLFLQTLDGPNHSSKYPDYPSLPTANQYYLSDLFFTIIFTPELLIRLIIWPSLWKDHEYLTERRMKPFLRDFFNWFDVAALIPFYTDMIFGRDKSFVIMRLCRLLRIFKLARNHSGTYILLRAIRASMAPISIALIFFLEIVLFFSVVMYMVDPNVDRSVNGFTDLLTSGYFVVVTVATIGYGDITPTKGNVASRVFAVMIIMSGTLFLSMPLAIIGTEFDRAWKEHAESVQKYQRQGLSTDSLTVAGENDPDHKHEVLVKYNAPNRLYLRLAALTGEASLMVQALVTEAMSSEVSVTKLQEITEDLQQQTQLCVLKCEEVGAVVQEMIIAEAEQKPEIFTWKKWWYVTLSDHKSSLVAKCIHNWIAFCLIFSMIIVVFQTMPELQTYGETTFLCERVVKKYCYNAAEVTYENDPGCFQVQNRSEMLRFGCSNDEKKTDPSCYGYEYNFGSAMDDGLSCNNGTIVAKVALSELATNQSLTFQKKLPLIYPFRLDAKLKEGDRKLSVCKKYQCDNLHVTFLEFGTMYTLLEYLFTLTYLFEFGAQMFICDNYKLFFKNPVVYIEMASFLPFFIYELQRYATGKAPIYVIPPGTQDLLSFLRLLRVFRIFKIQQSIPVTKVLWESISKTSARLTIPYFMLTIVTTLLSFIMYELEKGQECFYGQECMVDGKNMTYPDDLIGSPLNKRFLVNSKGEISSFDDFFSAFWFVIVTLATIGYGDMEPVTTAGKLVAVVAMLFGACYTAMPLTLVGSQFNKSYREHKRREALLRTKVEVSKPYVVSQHEFTLWTDFAKNEAFIKLQEKVRSELTPMLELMAEGEAMDDDKKVAVLKVANELKHIVLQQKLLVMQVSTVVNSLRKEGIRLAEQQTTALQSIT